MSTGEISNLDKITKDASDMAASLQKNAESSYLTQFEIDARKQITDISERNKTNPENMAIELQAAYQGLAKSASPMLEGKLQLQFEMLSKPHISYAMELKNRIQSDKLKEQSLTVLDQSLKDLEKNAVMMLSNNSAVAYDASQAAQYQMLTMKQMIEQVDHNSMPIFSADQRFKYLQNANETVITSGLKGWFDSQPNKKAAMDAVLSGKKKFKYYDAEGNVTQEIDPYKELDLHTFDKIKNYMESEVKNQLSTIATAKSNDQINSFFNGDYLIDPGNTKEKKELNNYFSQNIKPALEGKTGEQKSAIIMEFINKSHIIPEDVKGMVRTTTRHGDVDQQAWIADLLARIEETNPKAMDDFSDADITYAKSMKNMLRYGINRQEAYERLKNEFDPQKQEVIKLRREDAKKTIPPLRKTILQALGEDGWFGAELPDNKDITDTMSADYRNIYEQEYIRCGDAETAKQSANTIFKKTYGVTTVNGVKEIVPYAPEKYYELPYVSNDWMREQLVETVKSLDKYKDVPARNIGITAAPQTPREISAGLKPSYFARVRTNEGYENIVNDNGEILYIEFNAKEELKKENDAIAKQKKEKVMSSEKERERINRFKGRYFKNIEETYLNADPSEFSQIDLISGVDH